MLIIVSIHASVKDATTVNAYLSMVNVVSIHASVKDATSQYHQETEANQFQSTHL